jgi:hypothetical protein
MRRFRLEDMVGGWFIGNFQPSVIRTEQFEATVRKYATGDTEPKHFQKSATEITVIIEGHARMGDQILQSNDIIVLNPGDSCDFEAITEVTLVAIKFPSLPDDKILDL